MEKILCYVAPTSVPPHSVGSNQAAVIREHLQKAIAAGLRPAELPGSAERIAVGFDEVTASTLRALGTEYRLAPGRVVGGLLMALHRADLRASQTVQPVLTGLRPQQEKVALEAAPHLRSAKCILAEVGTGVGKSILIAHLADYVLQLRDSGHEFEQKELDESQWLATLPALNSPTNRALQRFDQRFGDSALAAPKACVLVCAPTVKDVVHLVSEYRYARTTHGLDPDGKHRAGVVLGRGQFVARQSVLDVLEAQRALGQHDEAVERWVRSGMPSGIADATRTLKEMYPTICGLADDLAEVSSDFPLSDVLLDDDSSEADQSTYTWLRKQAHECDVLFATHSMLAIDNLNLRRTNTTLLPRPLALLVDEAHALEPVQAQVASRGVSLIRLAHALRTGDWAAVRCKGAAEEAFSAAIDCTRALRTIKDDINRIAANYDRELSAQWAASLPTVARLQARLDEICKKMKSKPPELKRQADLVVAANFVLRGLLQGQHGSLSFSPIYRHPSLTTGPSTVSDVLAVRWATTPTSMFLSGTLLFAGDGGPSAAPVIRELSLPPEHTVVTAAVHPSWLKSTPTVHLPSAEVASFYVPPEGKHYTQERMLQWAQNVARMVLHVSEGAAGGTLVLMTGYDRLNAVATALSEQLGERLVLQQRKGTTLPKARQVFRDLHAAGKRPVWLATGGAGTGLDLSDKRYGQPEVHLDLLLTDLVIPAVPFGSNRTQSHAARVAYNFGAEIASTSRLFRQWLGRLIRREGLLHRHIWVLDGRLLQPASTHSFMTPFKNILMGYERVEKFYV